MTIRLKTMSLLVWTASAAVRPAPTQAVGASAPRYDASVSRDRQIALALSAAPPAIAAKAAVYILGPNGYEKVREGSNGFSCLVDREWVTTMEPQCFDAEGSRTTLLVRLRVEALRAQGKTEREIAADIREDYRTGRFTAPSKPGVVYMLSRENWVFDPSSKKIVHFPGHLLFYAPPMAADLGYDLEAMLPYLLHPGGPGALMPAGPHQSVPRKQQPQ